MEAHVFQRTPGLAASFLDNKIPSEIIQSVIKVNKTQKITSSAKSSSAFQNKSLKRSPY